MEWYYLLMVVVAAYALIAFVIHRKKLWGDHITFYGPILAVKSYNVRFFSWFTQYRTALRVYGTVGMVMVAIISILMAILMLFALRSSLINPPPPTGIQNILLIPGVNDYVPLTLPVLFGLFVTIAIHEFGHGILCRVEDIAVKSMGILFLVIPLGFFVEPDEEDLEKSESSPKIRMFGAGIMNNVVIGLICFFAFIALLGFIVPPNEPIIYGIYNGSPAYQVGIQPDSLIREVNGIPVQSVENVTKILSAENPGDTLSLTVEHSGEVQNYHLVLAPWPENITPRRDSGFVGFNYYPQGIIQLVSGMMRSPPGILYFVALPFSIPDSGSFIRMFAIDTVDMSYYQVPFLGFWGLIHTIFWTGWISLMVGTFNAIPMVPLDGGYIMKEGVGSFMKKWKLERYADHTVLAISWVMLFIIIGLVILSL